MKSEPVLEPRDCIFTGVYGYLLLDVKSVQLITFQFTNNLFSGLQIIK